MQKCGKPTLSVSKDGIQLVSITNHFKFQAPDGKQRYADALDAATEQGRFHDTENTDYSRLHNIDGCSYDK